MREAPEGLHGPEILVLESHAAEARRVIAEYQKGNEVAAAPAGDEETGS
ncbi:MAG: hypothetical protein WB869_09040 [Candidatus Acidiferrales bacterium]|jgi:hypothetical protein